LTGPLAARLDAGQIDPELGEQLAKLAHAPPIAAMLASHLERPTISTSERRIILTAMAESRLSPIPKTWLSSLLRILKSADAIATDDVAAMVGKLSLKRESDGGISHALLDVAANEKLPAQARLDALAAVPNQLTDIN